VNLSARELSGVFDNIGRVANQSVERARLTLMAAGRPRSFRRGDILLSVGACSDEVLLIRSGAVKVVLTAENGAELIVGLYGTGELIGELGVLETRPRTATVIAQTSGSAIHISADVFRGLAEDDRDVRALVTATLRARLHKADNRQLAIASQDVPTRVAGQLLAWAKAYGEVVADGIEVRNITQRDVARAIVASVKTVDAVMKQLRDDGMLRTDRLRYTLLDPESLERRLDPPNVRRGVTPCPGNPVEGA
jgi:CRP/FNR family cyclic AMP-dependent transcriptional regulator